MFRSIFYLFFHADVLQTTQNKYWDCLYCHSLCNIPYVLQQFYTINVNFRLLQPDTDFIGVSNIQVCLGQMQVNANTISGAGGRGQGWHMKSSACLHPLNMKQGCPNLEILKDYFRAFFHSTWTQTMSGCIWKCAIGLFCRHLEHVTSIFRVERKSCSHIKGWRKVAPPSSG
jgi:hypothetical protein